MTHDIAALVARLPDLRKRCLDFSMLRLPGQTPMMHMGTSYLVADLDRFAKEAADALEALLARAERAEAESARLMAEVQTVIRERDALAAENAALRKDAERRLLLLRGAREIVSLIVHSHPAINDIKVRGECTRKLEIIDAELDALKAARTNAG